MLFSTKIIAIYARNPLYSRVVSNYNCSGARVVLLRPFSISMGPLARSSPRHHFSRSSRCSFFPFSLAPILEDSARYSMPIIASTRDAWLSRPKSQTWGNLGCSTDPRGRGDKSINHRHDRRRLRSRLYYATNNKNILESNDKSIIKSSTQAIFRNYKWRCSFRKVVINKVRVLYESVRIRLPKRDIILFFFFSFEKKKSPSISNVRICQDARSNWSNSRIAFPLLYCN